MILKLYKLFGVLTALIVGAVGSVTPVRTDAAELTIGTGSTAGIYFHVGRGICRLLHRKHGDLACQALPTAGSLYNLENIRAGNLQLGIAQSDWQYHAYNGTSRFQNAGADKDLRALFSVHGESFTVLARKDAGINTFDDLAGKRVNIGNPGSGQRGTMEVLMAAKGWDKSIFALANELPASQQALALCHDRVQAMVYVVGHPNPSVRQAERLCDATIVKVEGPAVDKLVAENLFYAYTQIPGDIYEGQVEPVPTFGVKTTVVTSARLNADTVYAVVKAMFDNLDDFKKLHPAFSNLDPAKMITDGLSAPLHEGALRYYQERGWL